MNALLCRLAGGNRRSVGRSDEVVAEVIDDLGLFGVVFEGIMSEDPIVRMRAADVVEKVTAVHPECLDPFRERMLREIAAIDQQEVRWHVAQMLPRLQLSAEERAVAVDILVGYLKDESKIVKTFSMQALAEFALADGRFRSRVVSLLQEMTETGSPAMKSRGRRLLGMFREPAGRGS